MKFNIKDIFVLSDHGFDCTSQQYGDTIYYIRTSNFIPENHLKYMEIIDSKKVGKKRIYKTRLFYLNPKTRVDWSYPKWNPEPEEIFVWISEKILEIKLKNKNIENYSWSQIAKEELLDEKT